MYELKKVEFDREAHIKEILSVVKLTDVKDRLIKNLSKGYKQRVGIAQALIGDPKVVIFDEPTVGLDPKQILEVRNLIRNLGKRHTVILSTHILAEVQAVCERVIIINKGRIIADERVDELTKTIEDGYQHEVRIVGTPSAVLPALRKIGGVRSAEQLSGRDGDAFIYAVESAGSSDVRRSIFNVCAQNGWPMVGLAPVGGDLESIFIRLVDKSDRKISGGKTER